MNTWVAVVLAVVIVVRHRENIRRLVAGREL
jgi:glycerol-3-phosphate acyltransferase PlsY